MSDTRHKKLSRDLYVVLHDVRSVQNVGSIFRTADGAGVKKIYLTGYTPTPLDRFGRPRKDLQKIALGAEATVPWAHEEDVSALIMRLRGEGVRVIAVEQDARSLDYRSCTPEGPTAFIFGNEPDGLPSDLLDTADTIVEIPMHGKKESLNVSVAAGIILFQYCG